MIECKCLQCGNTFLAYPSEIKAGNGKYCSRECYYKYRPKLITGKNNPRWKPLIEYTCQQCGNRFEVIKSRHERGEVKFCSIGCYNKSMERQVECTCLKCGKIFYTKKSNGTGDRGKYCSPECNYAAKNRSESTICSYCGKDYIASYKQLKSPHRNYCSIKCAHKGNSGKKNHNWLGGLSFEPYCQKFNNELRERVRLFFDNKCFLCGEPQNGRKLSVHHVNYDKMVCCNDVKPLFIPLCMSCHFKTNHNRAHWEKYFTDKLMDEYDGVCYLPIV